MSYDTATMKTCRHCKATLDNIFLDLVSAPPSNAFLSESKLFQPEIFLPLQVLVCSRCFLVQVGEFQSARELFSNDYVYFSSYSKSWLEHCRHFTGKITKSMALGPHSQVIEIASNDGYLLQFFKEMGIPVMGIEPTMSTARVAMNKGIQTETVFFGYQTALELRGRYKRANLLIANNVLAHVPDLNDFLMGIPEILDETGVFTAEFPHLAKLMDSCQFDTIYHEHFSYFSLFTIRNVFKKFGLEIFDVEELSTHGGSLRIYAQLASANPVILPSVNRLLGDELSKGIDSLDFYAGFQARTDQIKNDFLSFLLESKRSGKKVAAYGAAAKGNTLLNYAGIKGDLLSYVADANPHKQGLYLPGSHIPVVGEDRIKEDKPDYIVIFPWNLREEISNQLQYIRQWGGKFVVAVPRLMVN